MKTSCESWTIPCISASLRPPPPFLNKSLFEKAVCNLGAFAPLSLSSARCLFWTLYFSRVLSQHLAKVDGPVSRSPPPVTNLSGGHGPVASCGCGVVVTPAGVGSILAISVGGAELLRDPFCLCPLYLHALPFHSLPPSPLLWL